MMSLSRLSARPREARRRVSGFPEIMRRLRICPSLDPDVINHLLSASGEVDRTLSLVCLLDGLTGNFGVLRLWLLSTAEEREDVAEDEEDDIMMSMFSVPGSSFVGSKVLRGRYTYCYVQCW